MEIRLQTELIKTEETSKARKIAYYVNQVKNKLDSSEYPTEETTCFCGGKDNFTVLTEKDRYSIPHRMVACRECGLIRVNPRMTEAAYNRFYNEEYRQIYDTWEYGKEDYLDDSFKKSVINGQNLHEFLTGYFDIHPQVVFDIGCNMGGWLKAFQDEGAEVYGVDHGKSNIRYGKEHGLNVIEGGIDELLKVGKKADFIILSHVVEHFLDLENNLLNIRELLADGGLLYVSTPGFFYTDASIIYQNAHTYQFTGDTLDYVMNCCGYDGLYVDDIIFGFYVKHDRKRGKSSVNKNAYMGLMEYLDSDRRRIPNIRTLNKFSFKHRKDNIDKILSYRKPDVGEIVLKNQRGKAIIIGGAPSVDKYVDTIKQKQSEGAVIFAIERMYDWTFKHDITPDYVIVLDSCDDVPDSFKRLNPDTVHLVAAQANPVVMEILKDHKIYVFNTIQKGINMQGYWQKYGYDKVAIVNGGGSVTLCAFALAMTLGYSHIDIFGFDCHVTDGVYANGIAGVGEQKNVFGIEVNNRVFRTTSAYLSFAQQFFAMYYLAHKQGLIDRIRIWGNSLVKSMANLDIGVEDGDHMGISES